MVHDPLSPREAAGTPLGTALLLLSVLMIVYAIVIVGAALTALFAAIGLLSGAYVTYRAFAAVDAIADAAQRLAAVTEHEADMEREDAPRELDGGSTDRRIGRVTDREE